MFTEMKLAERSMKSRRLNKVAFSWLHGGHHFAPQYTSTGLRSLFARANARSMSASDAANSQATSFTGADVVPARATPGPAANTAESANTARQWRMGDRSIEPGAAILARRPDGLYVHASADARRGTVPAACRNRSCCPP